MADSISAHNASKAAAGYLYQARLALAGALRFCNRDPGIEIAIEKFDDVSFELNGSPKEILQAKHRVSRRGDLTDSSADLWKTILVWSKLVKADPSLPGRARFVLVTTASAPDGSAASLLRPPEQQTPGRNPRLADEILQSICRNSKNQDLVDCFTAFTDLTSEIRESLVAAIEILDRAPQIVELEDAIEDSIRMIAPLDRIPRAREQLEGWWWPRLCRELQAETPGSIPVYELQLKLDEIRENFKRDALPLDMEHVEPDEHELNALDEMRFVRQLQLVGVGGVRMRYAKRDFFRASNQRSIWAREKLLLDSEVGDFESMLIEEWQPRFAQMCQDLTGNLRDDHLRQAGQNLYRWVENEARFPLRTISRRFLNVGTYHILSDGLRVGWHRDYALLHCEGEEEGTNAA